MGIRHHPEVVLAALNPWHAVTFFAAHPLRSFVVLGAVVLVITGGEALYADMGHFGRKPIRYAWFGLVLPCLLLNYFGFDAVTMLFWSAVLNGVLAAPLIVLVVLLTSDRSVMGEWVNPPLLRWLGWLTAVVMTAAAIAMFFTD